MAASILKASAHQAILARLEALTPESKALWGTMNVNGMLCHTADQIRMALNQKQTKDISNPLSRTLMKRMVLGGMKIPKGKVKTAPELAQEDGGTQPTGFEEDRKVLVGLLTNFVESPIGKATHPMFGVMTKAQWGKMIHSHLDHHLSQFGA